MIDKLKTKALKLIQGNKQMIFFVLRVLIIYIAWKVLLWFLGEQRIPIEERHWPWLSSGWETFNDWVRIFLIQTTKLYFDFFGYTTEVVGKSVLRIHELAAVGVGNYCLAIQLWIFFIALICSYPGKWINKLLFSIFGVLMINLINIIRIIVIVYAAHHYPEKIQFNHDYVFNVIIYIFTFFMWVLWVNRLNYYSFSKK